MDYSLRPGEPTPPLFEPNAQVVFHMIDRSSHPLTLIADDRWLKYDGSAWTANADESATEEEVMALLVEAGGVTTSWGSEENAPLCMTWATQPKIPNPHVVSPRVVTDQFKGIL